MEEADQEVAEAIRESSKETDESSAETTMEEASRMDVQVAIVRFFISSIRSLNIAS